MKTDHETWAVRNSFSFLKPFPCYFSFWKLAYFPIFLHAVVVKQKENIEDRSRLVVVVPLAFQVFLIWCMLQTKEKVKKIVQNVIFYQSLLPKIF